ncbi:MAG: hypothetical protein K2L22_08800 [Muribaculaceae bacterium]|nr:hypothetical protein [Muribaculaceae bacterium]
MQLIMMVVGTHIVQHRAIARTAVNFAENDDNDENGSPSHRKRTMTSCYHHSDAPTNASAMPMRRY